MKFAFGINFKDLAYLKMKDIKGDFERISYQRFKTSTNFDIIIAGKSKEILKYYTKGKKIGSDELIFPIMPSNSFDDEKKNKSLYKSRLKVFNTNLKKLAKKGTKKPTNMSPSDFAKLVAQQHPELAKQFKEFTITFETLMYRDLNNKQQTVYLSRLKQQYIRLKNM